MIDSLRFHEAPTIFGTDENDPEHGTSELLGVLGFCHVGLHEDFISSKQPFSGESIAASLLDKCLLGTQPPKYVHEGLRG